MTINKMHMGYSFTLLILYNPAFYLIVSLFQCFIVVNDVKHVAEYRV